MRYPPYFRKGVVKMDNTEIDKQSIIKNLKSQTRPVTYKQLSQQVGIDSRLCRELVAEIVTSGRCPIVSSSDRANGGYYIAKDPRDGAVVLKEGLHRIQKMQQRMTGFKTALSIWFGPQETLFATSNYSKGREVLKEARASMESK